ncbi:hypothetical protein HPULCUR_011419 [Helicostylum pulchrum]|uniref:YMC020W-like alpha/beta hydrolase domain-containing protein n=1 Tax=Helicostylum pulchrum TaxID=562976 RepID=A0ABP9YG15_9FUNG
MSPKRKNAEDDPDEEITIEDTEKKPRSESTISHSSWIYKLTATPPVKKSSKQPTEPDTYRTTKDKSEPKKEVTVTEPEPTKEVSAPMESDTTDTTTVTKEQQQAAGVWSWLGYSDRKSDEDPIASIQPRPSYWKSLFGSSNPNQPDSVIISDDNQEEQPPLPTPEEQEDKSPLETTMAEEPMKSMPEDTVPPKLARQPSRNNVVLPTFESQFEFVNPAPGPDNPSMFYIEYLSNMIQAMKNDPDNVADKKILIVGVHGWFPSKLVRNVLGEPTGTSIKFCEQMTCAVKTYFQETHNLEIPDKAITNIPLQWEGKVTERVNKLYEYLISDWKQHLESADIILWVTHSQGTPVSAILLKQLIEEILSCIIQTDKQPVCMLAMAGISHGPFPSLKGNLLVKYFEADAARELFEFMDSNSEISIQFREAMAFVLQNKVKSVLMGSMQDQVVPLYSAIMSGISHPNILRAVYIDGHIYSKDDFLIRLILFAIRLLNVGLSDHGFLIHISEVLAGNIYATKLWEGGHSTVYEELKVFLLPLQYLAKQKVLEKVQARLDPFQAKLRLNPFHLPWAMRGIWDDPRILSDETLNHELEELQDLFDKWNPTSAKLKEIKFRLEPLKARL